MSDTITNDRFVIDPETRTITSTTQERIMIGQYDHNSEKIMFEIPKIIEDHNIQECIIEIHYLNTSKNGKLINADVYEVNDLQTTDENVSSPLTFSWLISRNCTQLEGTLDFAIRVLYMDTTDGSVDYEWHTKTLSNIDIFKSISNSSAAVSEYSDILEEWRQKLFGEGSGGTTITVSSASDITFDNTNASIINSDNVQGALEEVDSNLLDCQSKYEALKQNDSLLENKIGVTQLKQEKIETTMGNLEDLETTDKTSLVNAINETDRPNASDITFDNTNASIINSDNVQGAINILDSTLYRTGEELNTAEDDVNNIKTTLESKEDASNKVQSIDHPSTTAYPSTKAVLDYIESLKTDGITSESSDNELATAKSVYYYCTKMKANNLDAPNNYEYPTTEAVYNYINLMFDGIVGERSQLETTDKTSVVAAINEVKNTCMDMTDRTTGKKYRMYIDNGKILAEEVTE